MRLLFVVFMLMWPSVGASDMGSLLIRPQGPPSPAIAGRPGSLFIGAAKGSLLAPYPARIVPARSTPAIAPPIYNTAVDRLRHVIGRAESPRAGYDAVQHGARVKPAKRPTQMTLGEIYDWIAATPGQPHAIGRYQFIPATLRRVATKTGARRSDQFSPQLQDQLADVLLEDAGLSKFMAGRLGTEAFINNLAAIWAGLPTTNGKSKYHGYAGNRATVTLAYFRSEIAKMRPS